MNLQTEKEVARMKAGGMEQITPRELNLRLEACGYRIDKERQFSYNNTANEFSYKARAMGYTHVASGKGYAQHDAPRDTLPALQEIRRNCFVFERGRIWEL